MWLAAAWILASVALGYAGRDRLIGFWGFFLLAMLFSPPLCLVLLILTAPRKRRRAVR